MEQDKIHQGHILHRRPYSNTSLLLECFTPAHGRFPALAKGVLSPRRPKGAVLQAFIPLLLRISGRGEVKTLVMGEADGHTQPLQGRALYCGFYLNELLMRLLGRHDPHPALYGQYCDTLAGLAQGADLEPLLRRFEINLLRELGYQPIFDQLADGSPPHTEGYYRYQLEEGVVAVTRNEPGAVSGRSLLALAGALPFGDCEKRQARGLMRGILAHYLGARPLKSRELFQDNRYRSESP